MMTISEIIHIIATECENSCTDGERTLAYFQRAHKHKYYVSDLEALVKCLDFDMIREKAHVLHEMP